MASVLVRERVRLREIAGVFSKYGLTQLANRTVAASEDQASSPVNARAPRAADPAVEGWTSGQRARGALTELGTTWMKFGQMLSVRPDVVGQEVADELAKLQADVPADPAPYGASVVEAALHEPVSELYAAFEDEPMASGSVAQVHEAELEDGAELVVKVLHEGVERRVNSDLELMRALADFFERVDDQLARLRPRALVAEFDAMMRSAIDLSNELANLEMFTKNFEAEPDVMIPGYRAHLSSKTVLTMERMSGVRLGDAEGVAALGWEIDDLVRRTTEIYLKMIFTDAVYHADPHPGNFLLKEGRRIVILDFGDVGYLPRGRREQLENLLIAMSAHDLDDMVDAILEITDAPAGTDVARLASDVERWSNRYLQDDLSDLDITALINAAMKILHDHSLNLPSDLATLFRVLMLLQGMAAQLGASNSLGDLLAPYVDEMAKRRLDPRLLARRAARSARSWDRFLTALPADLSALLGQIKDGQAAVDFRLHDPDGRIDHVVDGLIVSALIVASSQLLSRGTRPVVAGVSAPGATAAALGVLGYRRLRGKRAGSSSVQTRLRRLVNFGRARSASGSSRRPVG